MKREEIEYLVSDWVREIVTPPVELVDVEYVKEGNDWVLRVFLDKPDGIDVEDCRSVSLSLSDRLDAADPIPGTYSLEVSSPGLERPLKTEKDYTRFSGRLVNIKTYGPLQGKKTIEGTLLGLDNGNVQVEVDSEVLSVPLEQIAKARLGIEF